MVTLHSEVEEFLRLHERVRSGEASNWEQVRCSVLKERVLARRTTPALDTMLALPSREAGEP